MKWFVVFITFGLMACGSDAQEKSGSYEVEETSKIDTVEMEDSGTHSLISRAVEPTVLNAADSAYISEKLIKLNAEYYSERCEGREQHCDSLGGWYKGEVLYAKDSILKIFSFDGDYAGAYASTMYHSIYKLNNAVTIDTSFLTARKIIKLRDNEYLVLAEGAIRMRGPEWSYFEEAYLLTNQNIIKICQSELSHWIQNTNGNRAFYPNKADEIDSLENRIVYLPKEKILSCTSYGYDEEEYIYGEILPCYKVSSSYKLTGNQFKLIKSDSTFDKRSFH